MVMLLETAQPWSDLAALGVRTPAIQWAPSRSMAEASGKPLLFLVDAAGEVRWAKISVVAGGDPGIRTVPVPDFRPV